MIKEICNLIARWMGALVLLMALLSVMMPAPFMAIDTWWINPLLGVIMFGMGLTLSPQDFRIVFSRPRDVLVGCLAQFTIMPFMAWLLTKAFSLPADLALSVGMTATSTVLAPFMTPFLTWLLAGTLVEVNTLGMLQSIVYVVIAPILGGLLIQHFLPGFTKRAVAYLPAFSTLVIAFVVGIVVGHNASRLLMGGLLVIIVVMLHNLSGLALGYGIGRMLSLSHEKRAAISIEVGMQNSGLASSLATLHFAAFPMATIPSTLFSVWHNISGALVAKVYSMKAQRG